MVESVGLPLDNAGRFFIFGNIMKYRWLGMAAALYVAHSYAQEGTQDVPVALLPGNPAHASVPQPAHTPVPQAMNEAEKQAIIDKFAPDAKAGSPAHSLAEIGQNAPSPPATGQPAPPWSGYHAAESLATNGNPELALRQLEARLATAPDDGKAAYLKGLILMQMSKREEAERWFRMMQVNFPDMPQPYNALAVIFDSRGDLLAAQQVLQELLSRHPEQQGARVNLGNIYLKLARQEFEKALKEKPDDAMIRKKLEAIQESGGS